MQLAPTDVQRAVLETARAFARERVAPVAAENDRAARFPHDLLRGMGELGLLGVNVPKELGGMGAGAVAYALAVMELAAADCSTAVTMAVTNMVAETIARFGTPEQRARHLPGLLAGRAPGSFALSEPQSGSDAAGLRTHAVPRAGGWVLDGEKQWVTSGDVAGVVTVWARTDGGGGTGVITAFLVERGTPGLSVGRHEDKVGIRASSTVSLALDGCELPDSARLGGVGEGFRIALTALDGGRIGIASQATGTIRAALEASVRWVRDRAAAGDASAERDAIRFMLADMATDHDASRLLALRAAAEKEAGRPVTRPASMAKLFASEAAQRAVSRALRIHGVDGVTSASRVERLFRDARVQTIYEGTSEIQRLVIARELLR